MRKQTKREEAEELFKELQQLYKSPYFPSVEEKNEAVIVLIRLCIHGYQKDKMISKIKAISMLHGSHKTKLSTLIAGEFWNQEIEFGVKARKFKEEH